MARNGSTAAALEDRYTPEPNTGCWLWLGADDGRHGYGRVRRNGTRQAHRYLYEVHKGAIPDGMVLDHLCRTPACVNPDHLEPVSQRENQLRGNYKIGLALGGKANGERQRAKTHCPQGHPYNPQNIRASKSGHRGCKICHRDRERARRQEEYPENR